MRFEVPQFIEVEDKIFGPFTWRQFLYLGGGVGMAVVLFFTVPFFLFVLFGLPLALLAGALAFFPVNSRPFSYFLEAVFNYLTTKRLYLWRQKTNTVYRGRSADETVGAQKATTPKTGKKKANITTLARQLELEALQKNNI